MTDQARALRGLVEQRAAMVPASNARGTTRAKTVTVTSGKGGVGKSNLALNLAIALRQSGADVCLLDANLGLGNLDVLCGENGYWNLSHVVSGVRSLADISLAGPAGVRLIPGASGLTEVADCPTHVQREILTQLEQLEQAHDFLIIDTGSGIHLPVRRFITAADIVLILTTPEPTAIADAYATVKAVSAGQVIPTLEVVVNQAGSREEANRILERLQETARTFLHTEIGAAGFIPFDSTVQQAVIRQTPVLLSSPRCPASRAIEQLARRIKNISAQKQTEGSFFSRLWPIRQQAAA